MQTPPAMPARKPDNAMRPQFKGTTVAMSARFKLNVAVTLLAFDLLYDWSTMRRNYATAVADAVIWSSSLLLAAVLLFVMLNATHHWVH